MNAYFVVSLWQQVALRESVAAFLFLIARPIFVIPALQFVIPAQAGIHRGHCIQLIDWLFKLQNDTGIQS